MNAYSSSFATQFERKTGKPEGNCPSPLNLISPFNGAST